MKICNNCGASLANDAQFCTKCGSRYEAKRKTSTFKIILLIGSFLLLFLVLGIAAYAFINKDPVDRVLLSYKNLFEADEYEAVTTITYDVKSSIQDDTMNLVVNMIEDSDIVVTTQKKDDQQYAILEMNYDEEEIFTMDVFVNKEYIAVNIPIIYDEMFFVKWEELDEMVETLNEEFYMDIPELEYLEYVKIFNVEDSKEFNAIDQKKYYNFIKGYYEGKITKGSLVDVTYTEGKKEKEVKCREYTVTQDIKDVEDLTLELFEMLIEDEEVEALLVAKFNEFLDVLVDTKDYENLYITEDEIEDARDEFDDNYEEGMESLLEGMEYGFDMNEEEIEQDNTTIYRIDRNNRIRSITVENEMKIDQYGDYVKVNMTTETVYNKFKNISLDIPDIEDDDAVDLADINEQDLMVISNEIEANIGKIIMKNEAFQSLMMYNGFF
ncbi:zinc-ribbon domain-containing protein [Vallitalea okinawensis]|uniref:zinc-ribbon domain-containing protein n=1 Tax=Vallitalea okinawensis TaxID=2078660 RepID=UPI000CFD2C10|nr:DUF2116 family Zn-ribbon domain-containing protein [Vallitalea okinawensis]